MNTSEIVTRTQHIVLEDDGIVKCVVFENVLMELDDAVENVRAVGQLANGKKVPVLVDMSFAVGATKEARAYFSQPEVGEIQSASAIVVKSLMAQMLGNFFLGLNKTTFPIKIFQTEEEAREWLVSHI